MSIEFDGNNDDQKKNENKKSASDDGNVTNDDDKEGKDYEIDSIKTYDPTRIEKPFLVGWKNYGSDEDTWQSLDSISHTDVYMRFKIHRVKNFFVD